MLVNLKNKKVFFKPKNYASASRPFKLLHLDLFGLTQFASLGGKIYAFIIIDNYFRYTLMRNRQELKSSLHKGRVGMTYMHHQ